MFICGRMFPDLWYPTQLLLWVSATPGEEEPQAPANAGGSLLEMQLCMEGPGSPG